MNSRVFLEVLSAGLVWNPIMSYSYSSELFKSRFVLITTPVLNRNFPRPFSVHTRSSCLTHQPT